MLAAGTNAPDFELVDQHGERFSPADARGSWLVLYFYPRAATPGCTTQACGVRDTAAEYERADARVVGVSPDEVEAIARFAEEHSLGFTLLADPDHEAAEAYETWVEKSMYGRKFMGVQRATYLIDPEGTIARVFPKVQPKRHDELVLDALAELAAP